MAVEHESGIEPDPLELRVLAIEDELNRLKEALTESAASTSAYRSRANSIFSGLQILLEEFYMRRKLRMEALELALLKLLPSFGTYYEYECAKVGISPRTADEPKIPELLPVGKNESL
jgi:hypothetical protein